jgi:hypothetical protein
VRLTPPQTVQHLRDEALASYLAGYDRTIAERRAELRHPRRRVREEAAVDLAAHLLARQEWTELATLLRSSEGAVAARVRAVVHAGMARDGVAAASELPDVLRGLLEDPRS